MTSYQPQVGDIVSAVGKVLRVYSDGDVDLEDGSYIGSSSGITLVERPEPKVCIELTEHQARCIASCAESNWLAPDTLAAARVIREALNERS